MQASTDELTPVETVQGWASGAALLAMTAFIFAVIY